MHLVTWCLTFSAWLDENDFCNACAQHSDGHRSAHCGWNIRTRIVRLLALIFFLWSSWWVNVVILASLINKQESPAVADKPARCESMPKLLQFDVLTTLLLTILAYLHSFSCCCVRNLQNPEKVTENSNLWSSRSSKVIDHGVNGKPICHFLLVINCNFSRICYRFRDIQA